MREDIKKRWVEALRSGEYKQGDSWLFDGSTYCCLGVLCDVVKSDLDIKWENNSLGIYYATIGTYRKSEYLPSPVVEFAQLRTDNPLVRTDGGWQALASLNDNGATFPEIADLIESQL